MGANTEQWAGLIIAIVIAILGSSWIGEVVKYRMQRKDKKHDVEDENINTLKAGQRTTLKYLLKPWLKEIITRKDDNVGIEEFSELTKLYQAYAAAGGNGEVQRLYAIIDSYERIDDDELEIAANE